MLRWVACLAVLLPASLAMAQNPDRCLELSRVFTSYDALRQGTSVDVDIEFRSAGCFLPVPRPNEPLPDITLVVKHNRYLQFKYTGVSFASIEHLNRDHTSPEYGSREMVLHFQVSAGPETVPGEYQFPSKLTYEVINPAGARKTQTLETILAIKVVEANAPVVARSRGKKANEAVNALLIPLRLPVEIIKILTGHLCD